MAGKAKGMVPDPKQRPGRGGDDEGALQNRQRPRKRFCIVSRVATKQVRNPRTRNGLQRKMQLFTTTRLRLQSEERTCTV